MEDAHQLPADPPPASDDVGAVIVVHGSGASVGLRRPWSFGKKDGRVTVGNFLAVRGMHSTILGVVTEVSVDTMTIAREQGLEVTATLDLVGEIRPTKNGTQRFERGITTHPAIGDTVTLVTVEELKLIYSTRGGDSIDIGWLNQDLGMPALINVDEMLSKHFAILGTTGVGKSSGVAVVLHEILEKRPDLRIFLIDPHNEYGRCFGDKSLTLTPANLRLPFWLFNFEEIVDVIFRGRPGVEDEIEVLGEVIPIAKQMYGNTREGAPSRVQRGGDSGYTVDTPVPYRLTDFLGLIDERMGKLENRSFRGVYSKLLARIGSVVNDPRYAFMFENANVGGDTMAMVLSQLFRLPIGDRPMTVMQLAGFPAEVVDSVVSVMGRMAFDFGVWSDGALPLLFVCEEAHRYASGNPKVGFGPTRRAISRIAKEGRKYGVFLGLISQRPSELDQTIISQCSTLFVMRMANERDQGIVRAALSDAAASLLGFLPGLGTREVFCFGEGVVMPTRLKFRDLPPEKLPSSEAVASSKADFGRNVDRNFIDIVIDRWRGATLSNRGTKMVDEAGDNNPMRQYKVPQQQPQAPQPKQPPPQPLQGPSQPPLATRPDRYRIFKK